MSHEKICIFRTGALGDVILTLPVIANLHQAKPNAKIRLIGNPGLLTLANAPYITIYDINRAIWAPLFAPNPTWPTELVTYFTDVDLVISYLPDPEQILSNNLYNIGVSKVLTCPPKPTENIHATDHLLKPLHKLNIPTPYSTPTLSLTEADSVAIPQAPTQKTILIHPGSGGKNKCWPPEFFATLADQIIQNTNHHIALSSGPADDNLAQQIAEMMHQNPICLPHLPIRQFAAYMATCRAYLGNDSGPTHLAGALRLPTLALFGPTEPAIWAPRGPSIHIIQSPTTSMTDISPNEVIQTLTTIIGSHH